MAPLKLWQKARSLGNANSTNVSTQVVPPPTAGTVFRQQPQRISQHDSAQSRREMMGACMLNNVEENWQAPHKITQRPDHQHLGRQSSRRFHSSHSTREDGQGACDHLTRCVHPAPPMRRLVSPIRKAHPLSPMAHAAVCMFRMWPPCSHHAATRGSLAHSSPSFITPINPLLNTSDVG
jgi:hypothetical protein